MRTPSLFLTSVLAGTLILAAGTCHAQGSLAGPAKQTVEGQTNINDVIFSGRLSLGVTSGVAEELVYEPSTGHMNSKLTWDIDGVVMLGGGVSVTPVSWLRFNADVATAITEGNGAMDDYDWMVDGWDQYTHWSHHEDLTVDSGLMFDVNVELAIMRQTQTVLYAIIGYKHENWEWSARGGDYVYSTYYLYDTVGSFPDGQLGITYEQTYNTPYIGIGFEALLNPVTLNGRLIGSTIVTAEDRDHHVLRDLVFEEDFDSGTMIGIDFSAKYSFNKNLALVGAYHYQEYGNLEGGMTVTDLSTGEVTHYGGKTSGINQELSVFTISLVGSF